MESICPDQTLRGMNLNLCILRMLEEIYLLGAAHIIIHAWEKLMYLFTFSLVYKILMTKNKQNECAPSEDSDQLIRVFTVRSVGN